MYINLLESVISIIHQQFNLYKKKTMWETSVKAKSNNAKPKCEQNQYECTSETKRSFFF